MSDPVEFIVTLAPGTSPADVAPRLREHGFETTSILEALSMIVGVADPQRVETIHAMPEVSAIEPSHPIVLPPEDPQ